MSLVHVLPLSSDGDVEFLLRHYLSYYLNIFLFVSVLTGFSAIFAICHTSLRLWLLRLEVRRQNTVAEFCAPPLNSA